MFEGIDVFCPNCGGSHYETTPAYRPDIISSGDMFEMKPYYKLNGWTGFQHYRNVVLGELFCPECEGVLGGHNGIVRVNFDSLYESYNPEVPAQVEPTKKKFDSIDSFLDSAIKEKKVKCEICGKMFSEKGIKKHLSAHKKRGEV